MGEGTGDRNRGTAHSFRELTYRQSDDGASLINLLAIECVYIYATCIERVPGPADHHAASCEPFIGKGCWCYSNRFWRESIFKCTLINAL